MEPDPERTARVPTDCGDDLVVREEPLVIEVAGETVLTMRTPGDDEDLALGFLLAEGILAAASDATRIVAVPRRDPAAEEPVDVVRVSVAAGKEPGPPARQRLSRAHAVRASCGLCGLATAEGLTRGLRPLPPEEPRVDLPGLTAMLEAMNAAQAVFAATGGCHAAGVFSADTGEAWAIREDVGRHNAVDKALGRAAADGRDLSRAVVTLSGRGGFELVLKALRLGVPVVASVSAPSSLAVELAEEHGQTLLGFVRGGGRGKVYADDGRIASRPVPRA